MYSKLFASILNSSLWSEDSDTCKVWITLLAMADREGYVFGSTAGIARIAALPPILVESVMEKFLSPDLESADLSRCPENEGRRIEVIPGGWRLLNFEHYRSVGDEADRREQNRLAQQRHREKVRARNQTSSLDSDESLPEDDRSQQSVSNNQPSAHPHTQTQIREEPPSIPPRGGRERDDRKRRSRETDVGKGSDRASPEENRETVEWLRERRRKG
jgi:hypothetical protein